MLPTGCDGDVAAADAEAAHSLTTCSRAELGTAVSEVIARVVHVCAVPHMPCCWVALSWPVKESLSSDRVPSTYRHALRSVVLLKLISDLTLSDALTLNGSGSFWRLRRVATGPSALLLLIARRLRPFFPAGGGGGGDGGSGGSGGGDAGGGGLLFARALFRDTDLATCKEYPRQRCFYTLADVCNVLRSLDSHARSQVHANPHAHISKLICMHLQVSVLTVATLSALPELVAWPTSRLFVFSRI